MLGPKHLLDVGMRGHASQEGRAFSWVAGGPWPRSQPALPSCRASPLNSPKTLFAGDAMT